MFADSGVDADLPEAAKFPLFPFAVAVGVDPGFQDSDTAETNGCLAAPAIPFREFPKGGAAAAMGDRAFDAHSGVRG